MTIMMYLGSVMDVHSSKDVKSSSSILESIAGWVILFSISIEQSRTIGSHISSLVMMTCFSLSRSSSVEACIGILVNLLVILEGIILQLGVTMGFLWPGFTED